MVAEMADRFYVNCPLMPGPVEIQGPEAHHLAGVCRIRAGDQVCLFNGDGHEYPARVLASGRRSVRLEVVARHSPQRELRFALEVAAPLPKGDRAQFLLEKLTEMGVTSFVPLQTRRSVVLPQETKLEKLKRYVIEASKQSGRNVLLQVQPVTDWETYCCREGLPSTRLLAHPGPDTGTEDTGTNLERKPGTVSESPGDLALAVGPEGGFTDEEIMAGRAAGWRLIDLGPRILRIETAALVLATWAVMREMLSPA
jgi:16S rRNA (uracil1498-N3)-methyltransferase